MQTLAEYVSQRCVVLLQIRKPFAKKEKQLYLLTDGKIHCVGNLLSTPVLALLHVQGVEGQDSGLGSRRARAQELSSGFKQTRDLCVWIQVMLGL